MQEASNNGGRGEIAGLPRKITIPSCPGSLRRPRLLAALGAAATVPLTWIHAPAGYGKSVLMASYLAERGCTAVWYTVDVTDRDVSALFHYSALAVYDVLQRDPPLPRVRLESTEALRASTRRFFESAFQLFPPHSVWVFDDFHEAEPTPEWLVAFGELAAVVPRHVRVLVGSRRPPPSSLARLRLGDGLLLVDHKELRFEHGELVGLLQQRQPSENARDAQRRADELLAFSEGWPLAAALLAAAADVFPMRRTGRDERDRARLDRTLFDYIVTEIVERLDPGAQHLLQRVAFLPWFTAAQARALTENASAGNILDTLHFEHALLERDGGGKYRMHDLLRETLIERCRKGSSPLEYRATLTRAALQLADADEFVTASHLLQAAEAWTALGRLVAASAPALSRRGQLPTIHAALETLPSEELHSDPWLLYWSASCVLVSDARQAKLLVARAYEKFEAGGDKRGIVFSWVLLAHAIVYEGEDFRPLASLLAQLADVQRYAEGEDALLVELAYGEYIARMHWEPGSTKAIAAAQRALGADGPAEERAIMLLAALGNSMYMLEGTDADVALVLSAHERMARQESDPVAAAVRSYIAAIVTAWSRGDLNEAATKALDALAIAESSGISQFSHLLEMQALACAIDRGDTALSQRLVQQMRRYEGATPYLRGSYHAAVAFDAFQRGDFSAAEVATRASLLDAERISFIPGKILCWSALAMCAAERGDYDGAQVALSRAEAVVRQHPVRGLALNLAFTRAYIRLKFSEDAAAAATEALRLASTSVLVPMLMCQRLAGPVLIEALRRKIEEPCAVRLLKAYAIPADANAALLENWPWRVRVRTFGRLRIFLGDEPVQFGRKVPTVPLALLMLLACEVEPIERSTVTRALWPGYGEHPPRGTLDTAVYRLRQLLQCEASVELSGKRIALSQSLCWTDARALLALAKQLEAGARLLTAHELQHYEDVIIDIGPGTFAEGETALALVKQRQRLSKLRSRCAQVLAEGWTRVGDPERGRALSRRLRLEDAP